MSERTIRPHEPTINRHQFVPHYLGVISNALIWSQSRFFLEAFDCGINEIRVISVLADCGELTGRGFCDALMMNKSIVSRTLRDLEDKHLIQSPGEGHNRKYQLTDSGYALNAKIVKISLERERRLLRGFSERDKVIMLGYLAKMVENLEHTGDFDDLLDGLGMREVPDK